MRAAALLFCLALVVPSSAHAWDPLASCGGGNYTAWVGTPSTTWNFATNYPSGDFSMAETLSIFTDSFEEWGEPGCSSFTVQQGAGTTMDPMDWGANGAAGFYESSWPPSLGSGVLAVTFPSWGGGCQMTSASMVVNGYHHTWISGPSGNDLESVVTHEVGHWVGLDHSTYSDSTMTAYYSGGIGDRTLSCDDTDAACTLYPSGGTACGAPGGDDYCPCGQSCVGGWCNGVESGDPWGGGGDDDDDIVGDDDDDDGPNGGCVGPPESYFESEPNDWNGETDFDGISGSGGDLVIDASIACGNDGSGWTSDIDWFVVDVPCADQAWFTVDWGGGTSDLDFWVYDENSDLMVNNMDEDYAGPVTEQGYADGRVYVAVACWGGPTVNYTVEVDFAPYGYSPPDPGDDDDAAPDDDDAGPDDDDATAPPLSDDDDAVSTDDDDAGPEDEPEGELEPAPGQDFRSIGCQCGATGSPDGSGAGLLLLLLLSVPARARRRRRRPQRG